MLAQFTQGFHPTGRLEEDVLRFLNLQGHIKIATHCAEVAKKASQLAEKFGCDPQKAEQAGYLHDVGKVIPYESSIEYARNQKVELLPVEISCPMIIHQKLSVVFAKEIFGITDREVLTAIECHTTLRGRATNLDKVVFLADKIVWDQNRIPPYYAEVMVALEKSLNAAILEYLNYLWKQRKKILVIHPWLVEAREELLQS